MTAEVQPAPIVHYLDPKRGVWCGEAKRTNSWAATTEFSNVTCPMCRAYLDAVEVMVKSRKFTIEGIEKL